MARYRAVILSRGGKTSRLGDTGKGMVVNVDGWRCGISVAVTYNPESCMDEFVVHSTGGTQGGQSKFVYKVAG